MHVRAIDMFLSLRRLPLASAGRVLLKAELRALNCSIALAEAARFLAVITPPASSA